MTLLKQAIPSTQYRCGGCGCRYGAGEINRVPIAARLNYNKLCNIRYLSLIIIL